jgi:hypothetical protein
MEQNEKQPRQAAGENASIDPCKPGVLPPETAEDHIICALKKVGLDEVMRILRDWCSRKKIKGALINIHHRDPIDQFTQIRRHAVELYANEHNITPSRLMLKLESKPVQESAMRSAREKLEKARDFVNQDNNALIAARALAEIWGENIRKGMDADAHLKKLNILSSDPTPEV